MKEMPIIRYQYNFCLRNQSNGVTRVCLKKNEKKKLNPFVALHCPIVLLSGVVSSNKSINCLKFDSWSSSIAYCLTNILEFN